MHLGLRVSLQVERKHSLFLASVTSVEIPPAAARVEMAGRAPLKR